MQYEFLAQIYDELMAQVDHAEWADFMMRMVKEQGEDPIHILELGCGTGNITKELLLMNYEVVGIDVSDEMLDIAREKTERFGNRIILINQDITMLDFEVYEIDCVLAANDTFNYITDPAKLKSLLDYLYPRIKKGGQLVFDISSEWKLKNVLENNTFGESFDDMVYLWENFYNEEERILTMEINIFSKEGDHYRRDTETHRQRAYSEREMIRMLEEVGFRNIRVFGDFVHSKPIEQAQRIFFSCVK